MTNPPVESPEAVERSVISKVMGRLIPFLAILYMFNMLDRNNVAIAALGFKKDLHFSDLEYGFGAGIFYVGYFFFEVPSNLIMERVGARRWIARIMISWGLISAVMMFMRTPVTFSALRILLGIAEAGFYPGIVLYITYWVPSSVRAQVIARFLALTGILGVFGGPIGGVILAKLNGRFGLPGWQWLFLLEGIPSILLGFLVLRALPDGPASATWLNEVEKKWILQRLAQEDRSVHRVNHAALISTLSDRRVLHLCLIFILTSIAGNSVGFFGPELIKATSKGLWTDAQVAFSLAIPAFVGAVAMLIAARHSDRTGNRRSHIALGYLVAGVSFLACVHAPSAMWIVTALSINALGERCAAGSYWAVTTNLMGARAAAGGIAFINSVGNLGGFFGPVLMGFLKQKTHGEYTAGLYAATAFMVAGALFSLLLKRQEPSEAVAATSSEETPVDEATIAAIAQPEQTPP